LRKVAKSRTLWFAFALAMFSVVETQVGVFQKYIGEEHFGLFTLAVSMTVAWLRFITTTPVDEK
jgi:hypothetical protein